MNRAFSNMTSQVNVARETGCRRRCRSLAGHLGHRHAAVRPPVLLAQMSDMLAVPRIPGLDLSLVICPASVSCLITLLGDGLSDRGDRLSSVAGSSLLTLREREVTFHRTFDEFGPWQPARTTARVRGPGAGVVNRWRLSAWLMTKLVQLHRHLCSTIVGTGKSTLGYVARGHA
jgi:hypothetical protein